ncbi:MAG: NYN domain-containing protein, partial [Acidimicrobiales bacterium]
MLARHVVVDGSNIATEGRSLPSLAQLDEAVREYRREFADDTITVVVDATFGHRIPESERRTFDEAVAHNEVVSPPAGAIGRGDAFLLRVAEKVHATVLSNDSFQEFHGEHEWLFDFGRLIGGKPVPGVGWIFTPRTPVRGPRSREALRTAQRADRKPKAEEQQKKVQRAIAVATEEAVEPDSASVRRRRRSRGGSPPAEPVNAPLAFIEFVAAHPLGSDVEGEVETFSSHGAFVQAGGARCYIPLSALGNPAPRAAKDVLRRGEVRTFVLQALDPPRRGIELALAEFAQVSGEPRPETVEDEINEGAPAPSRRRRGRRAEPEAETEIEEAPAEAAPAAPAAAPR